MKKLHLFVTLATSTALLAGCGTTVTPPTDLPTPTTMPTTGWHPRCFMAPEDRPRPEEHIPCPSSGGSLSIIPSETPRPSYTPTATYITPSPVTPIPPITAQQSGCLSGTWHQSLTEIGQQYSQLITTTTRSTTDSSSGTSHASTNINIGIANGTFDFTFNPDGTFTQTVNDLQLLAESHDPFTGDPVNNEFRMQGTLTGRVAKANDGSLVIKDVDSSHAKSTFTMDGKDILVGGAANFSSIPSGITRIGVSCSANNMTLSYLFPSKSVTVHLTR